MAPLDKKCQPFTFTGCMGEKKKNENKRGRAQPLAVKTDILTRRKRRGGVRVVGGGGGGGEFFGGEGGVLNSVE